ncbi:Hypothetical_protein [Hexamita inflata]|uniref:Hypothetical_protein n=1 Tax=Hexamita inflata TaxID=28002 RepID=A0AA86NKH4_9EUKA|nr:Hypothetical protein HINF_LOCUS9130 [Hexamita inflata]CAI9952682.1 Hypothetical protein HINF_LOCUS40327 [Hexamita inflata]CAI9967826.1 Hypothetical protein HINF_LOCUS55471 [Hexamita inflata]
MEVKLDWRKEQEDPTIGVRTQYVIYNQQRKHWTYRGPPCSSSPGSIQTILGISQSRKTMEDFFFQSQPGAQDEVWTLRLIRIIIQVVTVAFILNIQIMNAFLFLEEWNQVGQSGPALNNILMLLQNNSYFTYDLPLPFHNEKSIFLIVKLYNVGQS